MTSSVGDLVVVEPGVRPCVEFGRIGGDRLNVGEARAGVLLEVTDHWAEDWGRVLFSAGIGWIKIDWIE